MTFGRLLQPGQIGEMLLNNRFVMPAMGVASANEDGSVNQRMIDYYSERAKGGVGLIITQVTSILPKAHFPHMLAFHDDKYIDGMKELVKSVQSLGTKIACQSAYITLGPMRGTTGQENIGPSPIPCFTFRITPREISQDEIPPIIKAHGEAAFRIREAGFDALEIHAAHGYFLGAFLSPFRNRRTDKYGGSVENRARFACEVITCIRDKVGSHFPIIMRMNGSDFLEGGLDVTEAQLQAKIFVDAGVDAINVSAGTQDTRQWRDLTYMHPDGAIVYLAEAIKKVVSVPVITVGKIGDPILANKILSEGKADFIAMGRALLADPELPDKVKKEHFDEIRRCIYCNNCRIISPPREGSERRGAGVSCTVNPTLLKEREFELKPTISPKKVIVVGGGLAGMESARVLAERGHEVFLYEKSQELGGQWNIVCKLPDKANFLSLREYLIKGLYKARVKLALSKEVTINLVKEKKPDAVVVATGAVPLILDIPGANGKNVVQANDVITGKVKVGTRVVVIGGRLSGMEVASMLANQGKKVTLVTKNRLGENGEPVERNIFVTLRQRLIEQEVMMFTFSPVFEIRENGVYVVIDNEILFLPADTMVLAVGAKPENRLVNELQGVVPEVYAIGDCVKARNAKEAINEGAEVGRKI